MKLRKVKKKNLALFLLVCFSTAFLLFVGSIIAYFVWGIASLGAVIGGPLGATIGAEIGHRNGLFEAKWDRLVWGMPQMGLGIASLGAIMNDFSDFVAVIMAILGAGFGALLAKYLLRFFIYEKPPKIF